MATATSTALVVPGEDSPYAVLQMTENELTSLIRENLSPGERLSPKDLTRIKVPAGGATSWEVQTLRGEESVKVLSGILLRVDTSRAYWPKEFDGGNDEPQCKSDDGLVGVGDPGLQCDSCPFNEFESARNGLGKACKETRQLYLLPTDGILPYAVTLPPASLANFRAYRLKLLNGRLNTMCVVTNLALEKAENAGGIKYSRVVPTVGDFLDPDAIARIKAYAALLAPSMDRATADVSREDVGE